MNEFIQALTERLNDYNRAQQRAQGVIDDDADDRSVYEALRMANEALREAVELVQCLRRLVRTSEVHEIHAAFGAPGDFGYETTIGAALAKLYERGGG